MNKSEQWRDIPGYEGYYRVSSHGRVLSLERRVDGPNGPKLVRQRELSIRKTKRNRKTECHLVTLSKDGDQIRATVSRLMLIAFIGHPKEGEVAHFKDGNPDNLRISNLEWSTYEAIAKEAPNGGYVPSAEDRWKKHYTTINDQTP